MFTNNEILQQSPSNFIIKREHLLVGNITHVFAFSLGIWKISDYAFTTQQTLCVMSYRQYILKQYMYYSYFHDSAKLLWPSRAASIHILQYKHRYAKSYILQIDALKLRRMHTIMRRLIDLILLPKNLSQVNYQFFPSILSFKCLHIFDPLKTNHVEISDPFQTLRQLRVISCLTWAYWR